VARAKRTDRAEARRRHRAQQLAEQEAALETSDAPAASPRRAASGGEPPEPVQRPSLRHAFRASIRPANLREDLPLLPAITIRSMAVWVPALLTLVATVIYVQANGEGIIAQLLFQWFLIAPPIGAVFISGFLAPRASYLTGAIVGLFSAICLAVLIEMAPQIALAGTGPEASPSPAATADASPSPAATVEPSPTPAATEIPSPTLSPDEAAARLEQAREYSRSAFLLSPVLGSIFASLAAWYRRFLNLANPNRGRRPPPRRPSAGNRQSGRRR
jgi:hypothetical protein